MYVDLGLKKYTKTDVHPVLQYFCKNRTLVSEGNTDHE